MKLIAKKPCSFKGETFYIGNEIPADYVLDPNGQEKMGVLAIVEDGFILAPAEKPVKAPSSVITVNIHAKEGDMPLEMTQAGLQSVVDVLTNNAAEAEKIIGKMTDDDALILLHMVDTRKSIKEAAEKRAQAISVEEEGKESVGDK